MAILNTHRSENRKNIYYKIKAVFVINNWQVHKSVDGFRRVLLSLPRKRRIKFSIELQAPTQNNEDALEIRIDRPS